MEKKYCVTDISTWSVSHLKNAIWDINCGRVPIGGNCEIEDYREELRKRGEDGKGFHE